MSKDRIEEIKYWYQRQINEIHKMDAEIVSTALMYSDVEPFEHLFENTKDKTILEVARMASNTREE